MIPFLRRNSLLTGILIAVTLAALPVLTYPLGRDQGEFATIGRGILDGRIPYVDLWNPKPPAVFYVYALALALFGRTAEALRALDLLVAPIIVVALYFIAGRVANRRAALWAALVFPVFYFSETFWTLTQNDGIALLPMTLAVACMFKAADGGRRAPLWAFGCGALCALTMWFKYPFLLFVGAVIVGSAVLPPTPTGGEGQGVRIASFLLGALVVGLGGLGSLASAGALDDLIQSAAVTSSYTALGFGWGEFAAAMQNYLAYRWAQWGLLFALVPVWLVFHLRARQGEQHAQQEQGENKGSRGWLVVWLWLLAGLAIMLVQAKGYDYHWLPMLPPLALLAADALDRLTSWLGSLFPSPSQWSGARGEVILRGLAGAALLAILVANVWGSALPYLTGQETQEQYASRFVAGDFYADESLRVAAYLRQRVAAGDSLFIWGFRPEVYYLSGLNPATRFIFQFPLVGAWYPPEWKQENVDILWAAMPPYVLVLQVDYMPWVTGRHEDSNTLLQEYTDLNDWLVYNYERDTQIGNFFIWRRKPRPT